MSLSDRAGGAAPGTRLPERQGLDLDGDLDTRERFADGAAGLCFVGEPCVRLGIEPLDATPSVRLMPVSRKPPAGSGPRETSAVTSNRRGFVPRRR